MMRFLFYALIIFACNKNIYSSNIELKTEENHKSFTTTRTLPNVLWNYIAQNLDGASAKKFMLVSKLARSFVENRKSVKFKADVQPDIFCQIVKTINPQHLDISKCKNISSKNLYEASFSCPDLKYLNISHCENITSPSIFEISLNWPNLEIIKMDYCHDILPGDLREYLLHNELSPTISSLFYHTFKTRSLNLGRAMSSLYMYLND